MAETKITHNPEVTITHPDLGTHHIEYDPTKRDRSLFYIQTDFNRLSVNDMKLMLELITAALAYHKLSQEEESNVSGPVKEA